MVNSTSTPAPVTPVELLTRQLSDWHELLGQLRQQHDELSGHIAYCEAKIDSLATELYKLV